MQQPFVVLLFFIPCFFGLRESYHSTSELFRNIGFIAAAGEQNILTVGKLTHNTLYAIRIHVGKAFVEDENGGFVFDDLAAESNAEGNVNKVSGSAGEMLV